MKGTVTKDRMMETARWLCSMAREHFDNEILPVSPISSECAEELHILLNRENASPMTIMVASMAGIEHPKVFAFRLFVYYVKTQGIKPMFSDIGRTGLAREGYLAGKTLLAFSKNPVKGYTNHLNTNLGLLAKKPSFNLFIEVFGSDTLVDMTIITNGGNKA